MIQDTTAVFVGVHGATRVAELVQSILTSVAIIAGGAWAYFNYFKGRTFRERLELSLSAGLIKVGKWNLLHATTRLKNVGLSKVGLPPIGAGIRVYPITSAHLSSDLADQIPWNLISTVDVLEGHDWIEPGEALQDHHLFIWLFRKSCG